MLASTCRSLTFTLILCPIAEAQTAVAAAHGARREETGCRVERATVLPQAIASFGACASGGWLYVYGGHIGRKHEHSREHVVGSFHRRNLVDGTSWQALPAGPALQGTALVAARDGTLLRIGGMTAHNAPGADEDMHSTASVARFDPRRALWTEVTPLPEPRSSHDAAVLGDRVYVVGGWHLHGDADGAWHSTAWVADLTATPIEWCPLPPPSRPRRAAALAAFGDRLALLGGIDADGPTGDVEVFDPATGAWRAAPPLPGFGFGTAAIGHESTLIATVFDGRVLQWRGTGDWQPIARLEQPRLFHRLVPALDRGVLLALGGANRRTHLRTIEAVHIDAPAEPRLCERLLPAPGRMAHRQALVLDGDVLWAFGGNRGGRDRFAAEQFATDVWRIDLGAGTADRAAVALPHGSQSMAACSLGERRGHVLLGGLGVGEQDRVGSLRRVWRWQARGERLEPLPDLPVAVTQCEVVAVGRELWALGGVDFAPDAGTASGDAQQVLVADLDAGELRFAARDLRLPRPRRSFGAGVLGDRLLLVGGLGEDFAPAGPVDVLDLAGRTWSCFDAPVAWVSPQVAVLGERLYVACGGTMQGRRFIADPSLWSWSEAEGWLRHVAALPFATRHVQMLAFGDRLLFYAVEGEDHDRVAIRTLELPPRQRTDESRDSR